jgi:hypothetical protein
MNFASGGGYGQTPAPSRPVLEKDYYQILEI